MPPIWVYAYSSQLCTGHCVSFAGKNTNIPGLPFSFFLQTFGNTIKNNLECFVGSRNGKTAATDTSNPTNSRMQVVDAWKECHHVSAKETEIIIIIIIKASLAVSKRFACCRSWCLLACLPVCGKCRRTDTGPKPKTYNIGRFVGHKHLHSSKHRIRRVLCIAFALCVTTNTTRMITIEMQARKETQKNNAAIAKMLSRYRIKTKKYNIAKHKRHKRSIQKEKICRWNNIRLPCIRTQHTLGLPHTKSKLFLTTHMS